MIAQSTFKAFVIKTFYRNYILYTFLAPVWNRNLESFNLKFTNFPNSLGIGYLIRFIICIVKSTNLLIENF
jgi:hypothetical protein